MSSARPIGHGEPTTARAELPPHRQASSGVVDETLTDDNYDITDGPPHIMATSSIGDRHNVERAATPAVARAAERGVAGGARGTTAASERGAPRQTRGAWRRGAHAPTNLRTCTCAREVVERAARQTSACAARARGIRGSGQEKVRAGVVCGVGEETERTQRRGRRGGRLGKRCHYGEACGEMTATCQASRGEAHLGRRRRPEGRWKGSALEAPSHSVQAPTTFGRKQRPGRLVTHFAPDTLLQKVVVSVSSPPPRAPPPLTPLPPPPPSSSPSIGVGFRGQSWLVAVFFVTPARNG